MQHDHHIDEESQGIFIRLNLYDDIFSDFDVRPYSKRALSTDFLDEIKRASQDKARGGIDLVLHVPEKDRSESHEAMIKERLAAHFKKHYVLLQEEKRGIVKLGTGMVVLGIIAMIAATYIIFENLEERAIFSLFLVFLEPAAWFLLWEGMDQIIFRTKDVNPELEFYRKMSDSHARVHFKSY